MVIFQAWQRRINNTYTFLLLLHVLKINQWPVGPATTAGV
jgi:hypothetical protein